MLFQTSWEKVRDRVRVRVRARVRARVRVRVRVCTLPNLVGEAHTMCATTTG